MKITNEQLEQSGVRALKVIPSCATPQIYRRMGRASLEYWAPILLAEPSREEELGPQSVIWTGADATAVRRFLGMRLRSLLAKDDPAVEAVLALKTTDRVYAMEREMAEKIVAAVDAARKGAA